MPTQIVTSQSSCRLYNKHMDSRKCLGCFSEEYAKCPAWRDGLESVVRVKFWRSANIMLCGGCRFMPVLVKSLDAWADAVTSMCIDFLIV